MRVAPSILSADFSRLAAEIESVCSGGADLLHLDVMDGHFVPNITFGPPLVKAVRRATKATLDCHLMIEEPTRYVEAFLDVGADWVSVHCEAKDDVAKAIRIVRERGKKAGIALNPDTPLERARPHFENVDYVLVMSVHPGFGGQAFLPEVLAKVRALASERFPGDVEIDGGINAETAALAVTAGADVLVAGNAVFGAKDRAAAIAAIRGRR